MPLHHSPKLIDLLNEAKYHVDGLLGAIAAKAEHDSEAEIDKAVAALTTAKAEVVALKAAAHHPRHHGGADAPKAK